MRPKGVYMTLLDFILHSKTNGYATDGEGGERILEDGARGFESKGHSYRYLDRYYGFNPFTGYEHIYTIDGPLIWALNYYGQVLPICSDPMKVYSFLREALRLVSPDYPFRGPAMFEKERLRYENDQEGTLESFHGTETIFYNSEKVYILHYHGGKVAVPESMDVAP
jgi:hypothetical protein